MTSSVNDTLVPGVTVAGAVLAMDRFAERVGVTMTSSVLLPVLGSSVVEATVAALVMSSAASAGTATVSVMAGWAPSAAESRTQVTTPSAGSHSQPSPSADTNVRPSGISSVTVVVAATDGPALLTAIV